MNDLIFQEDCWSLWPENNMLVDFLGNRNGASAGWNGYLSLKNQQKVTDTKPWLTAQNLD